MEGISHALRIGASKRQREHSEAMADVPKLLWPLPSYKRGDLMPPLFLFGILLDIETVTSFFKDYSLDDVIPIVKKHKSGMGSPHVHFMEHVLSEHLKRRIEIRSIFLKGILCQVVVLWTSYTDEAKGRELDDAEKELCKLYGVAGPSWYLDGEYSDWEVKRVQ